MNLHKILAENMLRFGPKNLSESDKRNIQRLMEVETSFSYIYASTTSETVGNSTLMADGVNAAGLPAVDAATYPDAGLVVWKTTVPELIKASKSKALAKFTPVRTTSKAMDVLKVGSLGGDYAAGGSSGKIQFSSTSTDTIEASHNGLLVLARLVDTYVDSGKPAGVTFIVEMGAANRYGSYINLSGLKLLNLGSSGAKGQWGGYMAAALIPDGQFKDMTTYGNNFDGKTAEERAAVLNGWLSKGFFSKNCFFGPMNSADGVPKIDESKLTLLSLDFTNFVTTYLGKLGDSALEAEYDKIWAKFRTNWVTNVKNILAQYSKEFPTVITSEQVTNIITKSETAEVGTILSKAEPIMNNPPLRTGTPTAGSKVKAAGSTGTYELGKSKN
jgi:hypothetical protein